MSTYLLPILVLGGLGFLFGAILTYASRVFRVETDPRIDQVLGMLPGANCGGCGFPGCAGLATAIIEQGVSPTACPVLNPENRAKLAGFLGLQVGEAVARAALIQCKGPPREEFTKFEYRGIANCQAAVLLLGGPRLCPHRCLGLGSCVKSCAFDAIHMGPDDLPLVDEAKCTACGKCVAACPKMLIDLAPRAAVVHVRCNSTDPGAATRKACSVGCIGCKLCEKVCAYDAIKVQNNLARIDYAKCVGCGACVAKCPQKTIEFEGEAEFKPRKALIDEATCVGCTLCFKVCKFQAIEGGTPKQKHRVLAEKCVGCGMCVTKCPKKCISIKPVA